MKNLLISFFLFFFLTPLCAQEDRFVDISQIRGKEIYVTDNSALNVAYTIIDGKVKPIKKDKNFNATMAGNVYTVENDVYAYKKKMFVVLKGAERTILLLEEDAPLYLSSFISQTYWREKFDLYKNDYVYLNFKKYDQVHSKSANVEYDDLSPIEWKRFEITDNGASFYMCEFNGVNPLKEFKVTSKFFDESKDLFFIKNNDIQPYIDNYNARLAREKREKEISDSIANTKIRLAIAIKDAEFVDGDRNIKVNSGDTLAIFSYKKSDDEYVARHQYRNLLFKPEDIRFLDTKITTTEGKYSWEKKTIKTSADAEYLKEKGDEGKEQRFEVAAAYDDIQTDIYIKKLQVIVDEYNKKVAFRKKNQIFITGIGYKFDENEYSHRFGMYFDVYNCFSKTIKYVEFTMTNYNAVGDVQRDDIGRSSGIVQGIGPIEPEDGGRYSWDDIFWDDNNIIAKTRLTKVKFIFTDGTTRVFSGYANIKNHMTSDAWD